MQLIRVAKCRGRQEVNEKGGLDGVEGRAPAKITSTQGTVRWSLWIRCERELGLWVCPSLKMAVFSESDSSLILLETCVSDGQTACLKFCPLFSILYLFFFFLFCFFYYHPASYHIMFAVLLFLQSLPSLTLPGVSHIVHFHLSSFFQSVAPAHSHTQTYTLYLRFSSTFLY